jgi:hypothetical protein
MQSVMVVSRSSAKIVSGCRSVGYCPDWATGERRVEANRASTIERRLIWDCARVIGCVRVGGGCVGGKTGGAEWE